MSLQTLTKKVEKLQRSLHAKAKSNANVRFYSLWDKVIREDVLADAYRRCRANRGAAGIDGQSFDDIETQGRTGWLADLTQELAGKTYAPAPLRRVWIPKANGTQRPLGIPTIRDRVVQMAFVLVLGPIFEADLLDEQYGFRTGLDAKMAVRQVYFYLKDGRSEIVDGDLRDYFNKIPHGALMKCVARRVSDGQILSVIKAWLNTPVVEITAGGTRRTTEAKDAHRGTPQGGVISPLLANLYFRRFALALRQSALGRQDAVRLINYADDFVMCCKPGYGDAAMTFMRRVMGLIGLEVNEEKTQLVSLPKDQFSFLGYTFGYFYGYHGRQYLGTKISKKAYRSVVGKIHEETSVRWNQDPPSRRILEVNRILRGWCGYFDQGPVHLPYRNLRVYTERRFRRWLMLKHKRRGTGYRQYSDAHLYETLGLYKPHVHRLGRTRAKA